MQTTLATAAGYDTMVAPEVTCTGHVHAKMALPPEPSVGHVPSNTLPLANSLLDTMLLTDGDIGDIAGSDVVVSCAAPSAGRCVPTSTVLSLANLFLDKPSTASGAVTTVPAVPTNAHLPPANSFLGTILASSAGSRHHGAAASPAAQRVDQCLDQTKMCGVFTQGPVSNDVYTRDVPAAGHVGAGLCTSPLPQFVGCI